MGNLKNTADCRYPGKKLADCPPITPLVAKKRAEGNEIKMLSPSKPLKTQESEPVLLDNPIKIDPDLVTYHNPTGFESEVFKILRTNILHPQSGSPPKTILVTSAIPGDGKSFVASNLAISITHGIEEHVLLMDCDLRRPTIHTRFGFEHQISGLSDYLSKKKPLDGLFKKTAVDKLTILPSGPTPPNPSELLSSQAMKGLLQEVRDRYEDRFIVIDSPPPQLTAETAVLANYIDGILLVVRYGTTPKDLIKALVEKLGKDKVIGVVLNDYRIPTTDRYGYGRSYKYKKYGYRS